MSTLQEIFDAIEAEGFSERVVALIDNYINDILNGKTSFLDSIFQSMQDSARLVRLLLGRPSSHATREQALKQVQMLEQARLAAQTTIGAARGED